MAELTLPQISEEMRDIDIAVLTTRTAGGALAGRPMSNNRDVEFDGDASSFTTEDTGTVEDIRADRNVALSYRATTGALHMKPFYITVSGEAELIQDRGAFDEHWNKDLDRWFEQGADTPGLILIKVVATRLHYWNGSDEGEIKLRAGASNRAQQLSHV
jgi:general stress protein 26